MDYRKMSLDIANKKAISKEEGLRLKPYFVEYARQSAERAGIDTMQFKRTNSLCNAYPLFRDLFVVMDVITEQAKCLSTTNKVKLNAEELKVIEDRTVMCMQRKQKTDTGSEEVDEAEDLFPDGE